MEVKGECEGCLSLEFCPENVNCGTFEEFLGQQLEQDPGSETGKGATMLCPIAYHLHAVSARAFCILIPVLAFCLSRPKREHFATLNARVPL